MKQTDGTMNGKTKWQGEKMNNFRFQDLLKNNKSRRILKKFRKDRAEHKSKKERKNGR